MCGDCRTGKPEKLAENSAASQVNAGAFGWSGKKITSRFLASLGMTK
jgi:hypothetical protein